MPSDLAALAGKDLKESQQTMQANGREIVYSSFASKKHYWWNDATKACVSLKIDAKNIGSFANIDEKERTKRLAAARKLREGYFDGPSSIHGPALDKEREKLAAEGFKVTISTKGLTNDGRSGEYWWNAGTSRCLYVVFETKSGNWVKNVNSEAKQCKNPAPPKKEVAP